MPACAGRFVGAVDAIPLYADSLGMSGVTIGALIALPVGLQITFNLVGGAFTDRIGGRAMQWCAFRAC